MFFFFFLGGGVILVLFCTVLPHSLMVRILRVDSNICYVPGVTRKEQGNQIMTNYYSQESQQQALLKFNNLLRNDKIINYQKQWKICTIKESLVYSTLILSPNCPSELTHTNQHFLIPRFPKVIIFLNEHFKSKSRIEYHKVIQV